LLQALSEELLKLKSASEHYEETGENLQKMCESIDKISQTHQKLTENMNQATTEMEKANLENKKTREFIQNLYDEAKHLFEAEAHRHEAAVEASLTKRYNEISDEIRKQTETIYQDNANQSKALRLTKSLIVVGIVMEAVLIIRMFLF
jgi:dsDNA-specific endonuclease/ATPase MutS2